MTKMIKIGENNIFFHIIFVFSRWKFFINVKLHIVSNFKYISYKKIVGFNLEI